MLLGGGEHELPKVESGMQVSAVSGLAAVGDLVAVFAALRGRHPYHSS